MFNQKVNGFTSENPDYLNYSLGAPAIRALDIHNCGTTINKYKKAENCGSLPLQTWCSKNIAVESFAMRPIVNGAEYFENIKKYLGSIIYTDSIPLKMSGLASERYTIMLDYGREPDSSFLQAINLEVTNYLMYLLGSSINKIDMFKNYNPICEGFIINDIDIQTFKSVNNSNHFFHKVVFAAVNTTRYNTVSFKAELYQDTTGIMPQWNNNINQVMNSQNVSSSTNGETLIYVSMINLLNDTTCVLGQENDCEFKGYNMSSSWSQLLNDNLLASPANINWLSPDSITENNYTSEGNYDAEGRIRIRDFGPDNIEEILNQFKK
jgi:hypothetical protein